MYNYKVFQRKSASIQSVLIVRQQLYKTLPFYSMEYPREVSSLIYRLTYLNLIPWKSKLRYCVLSTVNGSVRLSLLRLSVNNKNFSQLPNLNSVKILFFYRVAIKIYHFYGLVVKTLQTQQYSKNNV